MTGQTQNADQTSSTQAAAAAAATGGLAKEPAKHKTQWPPSRSSSAQRQTSSNSTTAAVLAGGSTTQAFWRAVEMSSTGSECNGWGWKAARREGGLWLAWPREPAEARALRKLSRSVARTTRRPQPPHLHPFHASPWRFRQGFFGFCAAAFGCFCRRAVLAVRSPPVAVGMPSRCSAGTAAGTDAVHCACRAADR